METFVVRIWQPADEAPAAGLRGTVEYVRAATSRPFSGSAELLQIIESELEGTGR